MILISWCTIAKLVKILNLLQIFLYHEDEQEPLLPEDSLKYRSPTVFVNDVNHEVQIRELCNMGVTIER